MIVSKNVKSLSVLSVAVGLAVAGLAAQADDAPASPVTGNINVVSKYVLRGITMGTENTGAAVQGGLDYAGPFGIYAGYWGSSLSYTGAPPASNATLGTGFENDLYAGYKGKAGPVSYGAGVIYYAYTGVGNSDGAEIALTAGIGNASLGINYLTKDVVWGNKGDTYFNLGYTQPLPADFSLAGNVLYYMYDKNGKYITDTVPATEKGSAFRGVSLTLSHPLGKTGATMGVTAVGGGENRFGVYQKPMMVLSLGATF